MRGENAKPIKIKYEKYDIEKKIQFALINLSESYL